MHLVTLRPRNNHCDSLSCLPTLITRVTKIGVDRCAFRRHLKALRLLLGRGPSFVPKHSEGHCEDCLSSVPTRRESTLRSCTGDRPSVISMFIPTTRIRVPISNLVLKQNCSAPKSIVGTCVLTRPRSNVIGTSLGLVELTCSTVFRVRGDLTRGKTL